MSRYIPPAAPPPALPPVPPALDPPVPPQDSGPGWGAFAGPVLVGAALLWGAGQALAAGWDAGGVAFWGLVGEGLVAGRLAWVARTERRARARDAAYHAALRQYWSDSLAARRAAYAGQVGAVERWTEQVLGRAPTEPAPAVNPTQYFERALAPLAARLDALAAQLAEQEARARVAPPAGGSGPPEQVTTHLDDGRALLEAAYENGPARVLVATAWAGRPITHEALAEGSAPYMTSPQWKAVTALLGEAGILTKTGQTRPWQLAAAYRLPTEAACHAAVVDRLVAVDCAPGLLPGDLQAS